MVRSTESTTQATGTDEWKEKAPFVLEALGGAENIEKLMLVSLVYA